MRYKLRIIICLIALCIVRGRGEAQITLEYCLNRAESNYPVIKNYGVVEKSAELDISDINKSWLPQGTVYVQGTAQNAVPEFPDALRGMLDKVGQNLQGMGKVQYKAGVDVSQTVWDGGVSKSQREMARARQAESRAALDVEMYAVRDRVENLYFGILLMGEQIRQVQSTLALLGSNLEMMRSLLRNGAAMQSDVDMVEAQQLSVSQQLASAHGRERQYRRMLELFMGEPIGDQTLVRPEAAMPGVISSDRPELRLFDARKKANSSRQSLINASLMPKIGLFAQAYYGYPGFDYFSAMRSRDLSFNVMAGIKVTYSLSALYSRRNDNARVKLADSSVDYDRERFLFESGISSSRLTTEIATMRDVMAEDGRISALRANVRKAAESQLRNGVIDATALLAKINDENQANLTAAYHEIELLRLIYQLKNTLNR